MASIIRKWSARLRKMGEGHPFSGVPDNGIDLRSRGSLRGGIFIVVGLFLMVWGRPGSAAVLPPAKNSDLLIFQNGDKVTGELERAEGGTVYFKTEGAGELKILWKNIKELHTQTSFAVIRFHIKARYKDSNKDIPVGPIDVVGQTLTVRAPEGGSTIPVSKINHLVKADLFKKTVNNPPNFIQGWSGSITAGASLVESTQTLSTFNTGISLLRNDPSVPWMAQNLRSILGFTSTYGSISQPNTPTIETSIYHGNAEQDKYFTKDLYGLVQSIIDHNSTQGLDLQQIYGAGFGYTVYKSSAQEFDLTGSLTYTRQNFVLAADNQNLVGATFSDHYSLKFSNKMLLTQLFSITPQFNYIRAYFANFALGLVIPMFDQLSFSIQATDSYLNNPPPGFNPNTLITNIGLTYTLP